MLPLFSDADLCPFELQLPGDEVVVRVVVLDDPQGAEVRHVVHVRHVGHHRPLLHHKCHGQEQQETGQKNIFFSEIFEITARLHSQVSGPPARE